ncbi:hypothetical protein [Paenibacillus nasutitermitis]|uniref:Uncharacterized protein n=1 Tax=Paenibacillus nasutitermitis TaxID=1652958 RepID=A0A916ZC52_9BACL|nr:hypothetical protein [Paenibacillus nasutitermitis]GGD86314.1 hypothetical protein GCM10010911_50940 [Paenibacillus nasutitermitis]
MLACKTMVMNSRQNVMIAIIIAAITLASVFSVVLYYNVATDKTSFVHLVGAETSNIWVQTKSAVIYCYPQTYPLIHTIEIKAVHMFQKPHSHIHSFGYPQGDNLSRQ